MLRGVLLGTKHSHERRRHSPGSQLGDGPHILGYDGRNSQYFPLSTSVVRLADRPNLPDQVAFVMGSAEVCNAHLRADKHEVDGPERGFAHDDQDSLKAEEYCDRCRLDHDPSSLGERSRLVILDVIERFSSRREECTQTVIRHIPRVRGHATPL